MFAWRKDLYRFIVPPSFYTKLICFYTIVRTQYLWICFDLFQKYLKIVPWQRLWVFFDKLLLIQINPYKEVYYLFKTGLKLNTSFFDLLEYFLRICSKYEMELSRITWCFFSTFWYFSISQKLSTISTCSDP